MGFIDDKRSVSEYPIKPRRTKGTYAHRARNYFASSVIAAGILIGVIYMYLPSTAKLRKALRDSEGAETEDYKYRKYSMKFAGNKSTYDIEKIMEEVGRPLPKDSSEDNQQKTTQQ